jgi:hypothetical protein
MADRYAKADELLKTLERWDLVTNYRCGGSIEELEVSEEGDLVRFEDVRDMLHASVDEALDRDR